jgi:hypothetical protein
MYAIVLTALDAVIAEFYTLAEAEAVINLIRDTAADGAVFHIRLL